MSFLGGWGRRDLLGRGLRGSTVVWGELWDDICVIVHFESQGEDEKSSELSGRLQEINPSPRQISVRAGGRESVGEECGSHSMSYQGLTVSLLVLYVPQGGYWDS